MTHLAYSLFGSEEVFTNYGLWIFLSVGAVSLFGVFIPLVSWIDSRRKEREAFYKAETFRRLAETSGEGAKAAIELLRTESRLERLKHRQGILLGGMINIGVGVGLTIFLGSLKGIGAHSPYLCGLIPGFIGVAMLIYGLVLAPPIE